MKVLGALVLGLLTGAISLAAGCGSDGDSVFQDPNAKNDAGVGTGFGTEGGTSSGGDSGEACTNLCLQQRSCASGGTTSLTGIVRDPAGKNPLYNVLVFVPNAPVDAFVDGASCDRCGNVSGSPLVSTLTGVDGRFKLDNVPVGTNIPLVIQVGKWRRRLVTDVTACQSTELDPDRIRLPKNKAEGDIPKMALTTGGLDTLECWLRKIGIDDSEFTTDSGLGRVNLFAGSQPGGAVQSTKAFAEAKGGQSFSSAQSFWDSKSKMLSYDIALLSCEGVTHPDQKPAAALEAMHDFANAGGRIFASHWHRFWFDTSAKPAYDDDEQEGPGQIVSPFEPVATWKDRHQPCNDSAECVVNGTIDTSFAKGKAMHDWLGQSGVDALTNDQLPIVEARHNVDAVIPGTATSWITLPNPRENNQTSVQYLSFNTPVPAAEDQKCGRVVYSDLHVSAADNSGPAWPTGCVTTDLSPQEKALEFMLFDLSSCIQSDAVAPTPPK